MKKMNNKGFSLVELIIVIAIMAILIGVLAPQYIKYVEKSRVSADKDSLDGIYSAMQTAASDPEVTDAPGSTGYTACPTSGTAGTWTGEVLSTLGASGGASNIKFKSKMAGGSGTSLGSVKYSIDANGNYTVTVGDITVPAN